MKKIIEYNTNRILDIKKFFGNSNLICMLDFFLFFNKNIFFIYFKVIWNCMHFGFSAIAIMACKVGSLCIEK